MTELSNSHEIEQALRLVGELLEAGGHRFHVAVIGGSAVNLLGLVSRATTDVDAQGALHLRPPDEPLPPPMVHAARTVATDLGLDPNWLNIGPASQWRTGLPPGLSERLDWRTYGGLVVGVAARYDLIFFKLYAAADDIGPRSVHFQDLIALAPTSDELEAAGQWVCDQDPSPDFAHVVSQVIEHARTNRSGTR